MREGFALQIKNGKNIPFLVSDDVDTLELYAQLYYESAHKHKRINTRYNVWRNGFDVVKITFEEE